MKKEKNLKQRKTWLVCLLTLTLVLTMIPMTAFAEGGEYATGDCKTAAGELLTPTINQSFDDDGENTIVKLVRLSSGAESISVYCDDDTTDTENSMYTVSVNGNNVSTSQDSDHWINISLSDYQSGKPGTLVTNVTSTTDGWKILKNNINGTAKYYCINMSSYESEEYPAYVILVEVGGAEGGAIPMQT